MMMMERKKILPADSLEVGMQVGVREPVRFGWKYFRYPITKGKVIKRISPQKIKVVMEDGSQYDARKTYFYGIDDQALYETGIALSAIKINQLLHDIEKKFNNEKLFSLDDDQISALVILLSQVIKTIGED